MIIVFRERNYTQKQIGEMVSFFLKKKRENEWKRKKKRERKREKEKERKKRKKREERKRKEGQQNEPKKKTVCVEI